MQIQVSINPHAIAAADLRAQVDTGLHALERPGIRVRGSGTAATEAIGLVETYQFIVDCGPGIVAMLPLVTAVLQLSTAILERRGLTALKAKAKGKARRTRPAAEAGVAAPVMTVNVNGQQLELPADEHRLEAFVRAVGGELAQSASSPTGS